MKDSVTSPFLGYSSSTTNPILGDFDDDASGKKMSRMLVWRLLVGMRVVGSRFLRSILLNPQTRKIFFFLLLNLTFTVVEALYGVWTNSLGLTSDAVHMLFDSSAIIFSLIASVVAKWKANDRFTYG